MPELLEFDKLHNTRDLGNMQTIHGGRIKEGKLIRSGHLFRMSEEDKTKMETMVDTVIDFRTKEERQEKPDVVMNGIFYYPIIIMDRLVAGVTREEEADQRASRLFLEQPESAKEYMCNMYRSFAEESAVEGYARFFQHLLKRKEKATLWHCTAGKDRAGIAALLVEEILEAKKEEIIADYLATNDYIKQEVEAIKQHLMGDESVDKKAADRALSYLFGARKEYLDCYYDEINNKFGSFQNFVEQGLCLSASDVEKLREIYLREEVL
ncbi:MAG: tyrosine-protein phosphatase [Lachnospiraceae bacterium]|nr:tyrosine-protein phosphatase [Lachnospiraceae bacterium]